MQRPIIEWHPSDPDPSSRRALDWKRALEARFDLSLTADAADLAVVFATHWSAQAAARVDALLSHGRPPLVVLLEHAPAVEQALALLRAGVRDVVAGVAPEVAVEALAAEVASDRTLRRTLDSPLVRDNLAGDSPAWRAFLADVLRQASNPALPMLLEGDTGTGKELVARLVHTVDPRPDKGELVIVDGTTLTSELAGSELFGHDRGAFTGAHAARKGAAALAHRGTLFLDEIGELHPAVQAQLLRLLQEGQYKAVGSDQWQSTRFRLIAASHRNLWSLVEQGRFRADLFFRVAGAHLRVPALRERRDDIPLLAERFLAEAGCRCGLDAMARAAVSARDYPGNVRELRQQMRHVASRHRGVGPVTLGALPGAWFRGGATGVPTAVAPDPAPASPSPHTARNVADDAPASAQESLIRQWLDAGLGLRDISQRASDLAIALALQMESNQVGRAARRLGVTERAIQLRRANRPAQITA